MSEAPEKKKTFPPWYERLGVQLIARTEGEKGFTYEVGRKVDEVTGAEYIFIAKVSTTGFAKGLIRIPKKIAVELAKKIIETFG